MVKQNVYDNEIFFEGYKTLRDDIENLNELLEIPSFRSLLPDLKGKDILELGCGFGDRCKWYITQGASSVTAVDISEKMIESAKEKNHDKKIQYVLSPIEDFKIVSDKYSLVTSSLTFHYVENFSQMVKNIYEALKRGGYFIFSIEHPIVTAYKNEQEWCLNSKGEKIFWRVDSYFYEGERQFDWFVKGVIKYHRTLSTILNSLLDCGFTLDRIIEPSPDDKLKKKYNKLKDESRRPAFLIVSARKGA